MPHVRKLAPEEIQAFENKGKGPRKLVEEQYNAILSDYATGEYGEALLEPEDNRLTVRNRLLAAAKRRGLGINFRRTSGDLLRFQITANGNGASEGVVEAAPVVAPMVTPAVVASDTPPARKKGGRPKKTV
jgi:hypothetical protein